MYGNNIRISSLFWAVQWIGSMMKKDDTFKDWNWNPAKIFVCLEILILLSSNFIYMQAYTIVSIIKIPIINIIFTHYSIYLLYGFNLNIPLHSNNIIHQLFTSKLLTCSKKKTLASA